MEPGNKSNGITNQQMNMKKISLITGVLAITFFACKTKEKTTAAAPPVKTLNCTGTAYTYQADIKPIMEEHCSGCHNTNMKAGYNFNDIESVKRAGGNGYLLGSIKHDVGYDPMPAGGQGPLDQATIDKIECWINTGMK
jgi:mono/diheme cytochrome c family protein